MDNTQIAAVKEILESGRTITTAEAWDNPEIRSLHLPTIIFNLKQKPYNMKIDKEMLPNLNSGRWHAEYFLVPESTTKINDGKGKMKKKLTFYNSCDIL